MVFFFFYVNQPQGGYFGTEDANGATRVRCTVFLVACTLVAASILSSSCPYLLPLACVLIHFFPTILNGSWQWSEWNIKLVVALIGFVSALILLTTDLGLFSYSSLDSSVYRENDLAWQRKAYPSRGGYKGHDSFPRGSSQVNSVPRSSESPEDDTLEAGGSGLPIDALITIFAMVVTFFCWHGFGLIGSRFGIPEWIRNRFFRPPTRNKPASIRAIRQLEDVVIEERHLLIENSPRGIVCPICLDLMGLGDRVKRLSCKHLFHGLCLLPWLKTHNSCPSCRCEMESNNGMPIDSREYEKLDIEFRNAEASPAYRSPTPAPVSTFATSLNPENQYVFDRIQSSSDEYSRLHNLSVLELKNLARRRCINIVGCVEKGDLVSRIVSGQPSAPIF